MNTEQPHIYTPRAKPNRKGSLKRVVMFLRWWLWRREIHPGCDGRMEPCGDFFYCFNCDEVTANVRFRSRPMRKLWRWAAAKKHNGEFSAAVVQPKSL